MTPWIPTAMPGNAALTSSRVAAGCMRDVDMRSFDPQGFYSRGIDAPLPSFRNGDDTWLPI